MQGQTHSWLPITQPPKNVYYKVSRGKTTTMSKLVESQLTFNFKLLITGCTSNTTFSSVTSHHRQPGCSTATVCNWEVYFTGCCSDVMLCWTFGRFLLSGFFRCVQCKATDTGYGCVGLLPIDWLTFSIEVHYMKHQVHVRQHESWIGLSFFVAPLTRQPIICIFFTHCCGIFTADVFLVLLLIPGG